MNHIEDSGDHFRLWLRPAMGLWDTDLF